ncbi:hypothetical protein [Litorihabitans aurantiacus]|uniref:MuF-like minor capsid protein n=1 Tax=Litorihabitans aurantiacus TaxID=1930061 RepID=A0AA37XIK8_9MICO|nr:hypothetical protein [Litorihabitans aurantiacus]GMA33514.1 hypothetical protein GCM10025875_35060 [Litorihabitans aurantiacus]GMA33634.1 hypothetical protein GCM10025875_36260 [Litorihabitans aurantiacus]
MVPAPLVAELRAAQQGLVRLTDADITEFFRSMDLRRPEQTRDLLIEFVALLVAQNGLAGAAAAADWFEEAREAERVPGTYRAGPADLALEDDVESAVRYSAGHLWSPTPELMLPSMLKEVSKLVLAPARETVVRSSEDDRRAVGWQRVTRAGSCKFCRMLASRGAVYRERTVDFAAHGFCGCAAIPSWDQDAPEVDVRAYSASARTAGMTPTQRAAHDARVRRYVAQMDDPADRT